MNQFSYFLPPQTLISILCTYKYFVMLRIRRIKRDFRFDLSAVTVIFIFSESNVFFLIRMRQSQNLTLFLSLACIEIIYPFMVRHKRKLLTFRYAIQFVVKCILLCFSIQNLQFRCECTNTRTLVSVHFEGNADKNLF